MTHPALRAVRHARRARVRGVIAMSVRHPMRCCGGRTSAADGGGDGTRDGSRDRRRLLARRLHRPRQGARRVPWARRRNTRLIVMSAAVSRAGMRQKCLNHALFVTPSLVHVWRYRWLDGYAAFSPSHHAVIPGGSGGDFGRFRKLLFRLRYLLTRALDSNNFCRGVTD